MVDAAPALPPLRDVIARFGLSARKSLGQHFLLDANLTARIARAAGDLAQGTTIEIGPGPGGLTRALLQAGAREVVAVERDERAVAALRELAEAFPGRLRILHDDALTVDAAALGAAPRRIVANLPYNIATPLLLAWLHQAGAFESMTLMFQKEVVDRLAAAPGSNAFGRLSVITQWLCRVEPLFNIDRRAFTPPPKVTSTVVRLTPRPRPLCEARFETLERVTAAVFGQRRKMLRTSVKQLGDAAALLDAAGIAPQARPETLDIPAFCALARALDGQAA